MAFRDIVLEAIKVVVTPQFERLESRMDKLEVRIGSVELRLDNVEKLPLACEQMFRS